MGELLTGGERAWSKRGGAENLEITFPCRKQTLCSKWGEAYLQWLSPARLCLQSIPQRPTPNESTERGLSVQSHEPMGDTSHSKHSTWKPGRQILKICHSVHILDIFKDLLLNRKGLPKKIRV